MLAEGSKWKLKVSDKEMEGDINNMRMTYFISHLPGELLKDIAAKSVQNGDSLGKVMSLSWQPQHKGTHE